VTCITESKHMKREPLLGSSVEVSTAFSRLVLHHRLVLTLELDRISGGKVNATQAVSWTSIAL